MPGRVDRRRIKYKDERDGDLVNALISRPRLDVLLVFELLIEIRQSTGPERTGRKPSESIACMNASPIVPAR